MQQLLNQTLNTMRKTILYYFLLFGSNVAFSQPLDWSNWFERNIKIRQSMETVEFREVPAQFQITLPKSDSSSWLVNVGVSMNLSSKSTRWISSLIAEYHKNTLTAVEQHNMQAAYGFSGLIKRGAKKSWFLNGNAGYTYDEISRSHSLMGNFLFTFMGDRGPINTYKFAADTGSRFYISPFLGFQIQETMQAFDEASQGLLLRPLFTLSAYFDIIRKKTLTPDPLLRIAVDYTGRTDLVNSTNIDEGYTQLLQSGIEWFLVDKPIRVSLGGSFNYGSDPLRGLAKQQYWLLSLNLYK
uniref:DUF3078 domain-containing protein n=1 Tax=Sphingobacterium sp. (strain 21) TaxID=743722 RepID=F4CEW0_SPHS2